MMMAFKRIHWVGIYAVMFLLFFIILFFDFKQKMALFAQKQRVEKDMLDAIESNKSILLNATLNQRKSSLEIDNKLLATPDILAYVAHFFVSQDMTINKIQLFKSKTIASIDLLPIKVNAIGTFSAFIRLIIGFIESPRLVLLHDFSSQINKNGTMTIEIQLWVFAMHIKTFKVPDQQFQAVDMNTLLHRISLKEMKWVGFLRQGQVIWGLLRLPTGQTVKVQTGEIIGMEKGRIVEVKEDGVIVDQIKKKIKIGNSIRLSNVLFARSRD